MQAKVCASRNVKERHAKCVCAVCCVLCTQHWALYKNERQIKQQQKKPGIIRKCQVHDAYVITAEAILYYAILYIRECMQRASLVVQLVFCCDGRSFA